MILNKWNYKTHDYEPLKIPKDWNCKTYSYDMDEIVNCPSCGESLRFADTFCSLEIHTNIYGFGYGVCEKCYQEEWKRRKENTK